jgi:hypothetical protein
MAKAPLITDQVQALIAQVYQKHPKWKAPVVLGEVRVILRKSNPKLPSGWPSLSTVQKVLAKVRKAPVDNPKDKPFCLGTLVEYPIPPEALPMVMRVWARCNGEEDGFSWSSGFSIRDALWVSRLSHLFKEPEDILGAAVWYSVRERAYEAIGEGIDTTDLDIELLKNFKPTTTEIKRKRKGG